MIFGALIVVLVSWIVTLIDLRFNGGLSWRPRKLAFSVGKGSFIAIAGVAGYGSPVQLATYMGHAPDQATSMILAGVSGFVVAVTVLTAASRFALVKTGKPQWLFHYLQHFDTEIYGSPEVALHHKVEADYKRLTRGYTVEEMPMLVRGMAHFLWGDVVPLVDTLTRDALAETIDHYNSNDNLYRETIRMIILRAYVLKGNADLRSDFIRRFRKTRRTRSFVFVFRRNRRVI